MIYQRVVRKLQRYFNPTTQISSPVYVRLYVTLHVIVWLPVIIFLKPQLPNALAFSGVLLGTLGAAILYRETVLNEEEIAIEAANISNQTGQIDVYEWISIAFNGFSGSLVFFNYLNLVMKNHGGLQNTKQILGFTAAILISLVPPFTTYGLVKMSAVWRARRARAFGAHQDFIARKGYITHKYRLMGMCCVVLGGWAQIPLILASPLGP